MNKGMLLTLAALAFGVAGAETAPTITTLPGTLPASIKEDVSQLQAYLKAGGKVELNNAAGTVIGTLNPDGSLALNPGAQLSVIKTVTLTDSTGKAQTYTVARDLSKPGAIKIEVTQVNGKTVALPLAAVLNRQADAHARNGQEQDEASKPEKAEKAKPEKPAKPETVKPEKPEKPAKPEKPEKPENPGKGKK